MMSSSVLSSTLEQPRQPKLGMKIWSPAPKLAKAQVRQKSIKVDVSHQTILIILKPTAEDDDKADISWSLLGRSSVVSLEDKNPMTTAGSTMNSVLFIKYRSARSIRSRKS